MLIADLAEVLKIRAREVPNITLERLIRESAREFFRLSRVWRLDFVGPVASGSNAYDLTLPTDSLAYDILYAKLRTSNRVLSYLKDAHKAYEYPDDLIDSNHTTEYIKLVDDNTFQLLPPPNADDIIEMKVVLSITRLATEIEDEIVEEFEDAILDGALARLYEMPGETWSDLKRSMLHRSKFLEATELARLRGQETRTPGVGSTKFSW